MQNRLSRDKCAQKRGHIANKVIKSKIDYQEISGRKKDVISQIKSLNQADTIKYY